jgi:hypothetical protein
VDFSPGSHGTAHAETRGRYAVAAVVEASQALPALDTLRHTQVGHLVLGTDFDPRDFASYAAGVLAAGLIDLWLSRRAHMRAAGS